MRTRLKQKLRFSFLITGIYILLNKIHKTKSYISETTEAESFWRKEILDTDKYS